MKRPNVEEKGITPIVGTLLLVAITVMLMATVGMFLFSNIPTTNPVKPQMTISANQISDSEYLIIIDQVTENIKPGQIILDLTLSNYSRSVMIHLSGSRYYDQYPVIMQVTTVFYNDINPITYVNSSLVFYVYMPSNLGLSYVSFIDSSTSSMIAENSVTLSSTASSGGYLPWESYQLSGYSSVPTQSTLNSSALPSWNNATLFQPSISDGFEFNVSNYFGSINSSYVFWKNNASFQFPVLNSSSDSNKGFGGYFTTEIYVGSSVKSLNISAYSNESTFVKIYNSSGFYNYTYLNYTSGTHSYANYTNYSLTLGSGIYVVYIYYFYMVKNGILAFKMTPYT